jgi:hypothetical protein
MQELQRDFGTLLLVQQQQNAFSEIIFLLP